MAIGKPHPLPCPHVFNNAHPGSWRINSKFGLLGQCSAVMPRHIYKNIHIYLRPKYILKWVCGSNSSALFRSSFFFWHFLALHTNGKRCNQEGSHPCYSQVKCVFKFVAPKVLTDQYTIYDHFFPLYEHSKGCGHMHVLKSFLRLY